MTEVELVEQIRLEEETLCCLPYEPQYKVRRTELTRLVNLHRSMLVDILRSRDSCDLDAQRAAAALVAHPLDAKPEITPPSCTESPYSLT